MVAPAKKNYGCILLNKKKTRSFYLQYFQNFPGSVEAKKCFYLQYFQKNKTIILLTMFLGLPDFSIDAQEDNFMLRMIGIGMFRMLVYSAHLTQWPLWTSIID
jgi:hypothetical protein